MRTLIVGPSRLEVNVIESSDIFRYSWNWGRETPVGLTSVARKNISRAWGKLMDGNPEWTTQKIELSLMFLGSGTVDVVPSVVEKFEKEFQTILNSPYSYFKRVKR